MAGLMLKLSILDTDVFINLADACKRIVVDDRVPPEHKQAIQAALDDARQRKDGPAKIYYECDHRACEQGCNRRSGGMCNHTPDIRHAKNFKMYSDGAFYEKYKEVKMYSDEHPEGVVIE